MITLSNFESQLDRSLLAEGHDYIENVVEIKSVNHEDYSQWRAKVRGTEVYRVVIQVDPATEVIRFNSCTCRFGGPVCKHQAAVLYAIQMRETGKPRAIKPKEDKASELLSKVTFEELKAYFKGRMEEDDALRKHFLSTFAIKASKTVDDFKHIIEQALRPLKRTHGFVHHRVFANAVKPIESLVTTAGQRLAARDFETAINIYLATLEKLIPAFRTIDDSNGILGGIVEDVLLTLCLLKEDEPPQKVLSDLVKYVAKKSTSAGIRGSDHAWEFAEVAACLAGPEDEERIKKMIVALKKEGKGNDFIENYSAERAANTLLQYFFNNKTEKEIEDFIGQNVKFFSIRKVAINKAMRDGNYTKVIVLCDEGIEEAQRLKHPGTVATLRKMMIEAYAQQKDKQKVVETAEQLFLESGVDLDTYRILKSHLSQDEWAVKSQECKRMLEKENDYQTLAAIVKGENNPKELLRIMTLSNNVNFVERYESSIPGELRPQLQKLYFSLIIASLEARADRGNYRINARLLKKMLGRYDDAATIAFANMVRERYKHRKALIEELGVVRVIPVGSEQ